MVVRKRQVLEKVNIPKKMIVKGKNMRKRIGGENRISRTGSRPERRGENRITRTESRTGTRTESRTGTRTESRAGSRTESRAGSRTQSRRNNTVNSSTVNSNTVNNSLNSNTINNSTVQNTALDTDTPQPSFTFTNPPLDFLITVTEPPSTLPDTTTETFYIHITTLQTNIQNLLFTLAPIFTQHTTATTFNLVIYYDVPNVLKKINLKKLKKRTVKGIEPNECTICLQEYKKNEKIRVLRCRHEFHCRCVDGWLVRKSDSCPICRKRVEFG